MSKKRQDKEPEDFNEEENYEGEQVGEQTDTFVWTAWNPDTHQFEEIDINKPFLRTSTIDINQNNGRPTLNAIFNIYRLNYRDNVYECKCEAIGGIFDKGYGIKVNYYFKNVTDLSLEEQYNVAGKDYTWYYDGNTPLNRCIKMIQDLVKKVNEKLAKCEEFNTYVLDYKTKLVDLVESLSKQYAAQLLLLSEAKEVITRTDREELLKKVLEDRHKDNRGGKKKVVKTPPKKGKTGK